MTDSCGRGLVCFTEWYKHGHLVYLPWSLVFAASPFAIFSLVALIMGFLELSTFPSDYVPQPDSPRKKGRMGKGRHWFWLNALCALIWAGFVGVAIYLIFQTIWFMLAYAVWGGIACCFHTAVAIVLRQRARQAVKTLENPQRLFNTQQSNGTHEQPDDIPLVPGGSNFTSDAPFVTTYGVIPGTTERTIQFVISQPQRHPPLRMAGNAKHMQEPRSSGEKQAKYSKV